MPQEGGLAVRMPEVRLLAVTLATETRMRVDGYLRFGVIYDQTEGVLLKAMKYLAKLLLALEAEYKTAVDDGERGDGESR